MGYLDVFHDEVSPNPVFSAVQSFCRSEGRRLPVYRKTPSGISGRCSNTLRVNVLTMIREKKMNPRSIWAVYKEPSHLRLGE